MDKPELLVRAHDYARRSGVQFDLQRAVGAGTDGHVWATNHKTVVKVFEREFNYGIELRCYQRLMERGVKQIDGLAAPRLVNHADDLLVLEITVVHPPYLLDFGKAYIDEPSPYTPEQLAEWYASWRQYFPRSDLPRVHKVLSILKTYGIEYVDPKPWNIRFHLEGEEVDEQADDDRFDFEDESV